MTRAFLSLLLLTLFSFSSCIHRAATDADTDAALGLRTESETAEAQQELDRIKEAQLEEQKRQLNRQITDPLNPPN